MYSNRIDKYLFGRKQLKEKKINSRHMIIFASKHFKNYTFKIDMVNLISKARKNVMHPSAKMFSDGEIKFLQHIALVCICVCNGSNLSANNMIKRKQLKITKTAITTQIAEK